MYANIQRFLQFQFTVNIAALIINVVVAFSSGDMPLNAVQVLDPSLLLHVLLLPYLLWYTLSIIIVCPILFELSLLCTSRSVYSVLQFCMCLASICKMIWVTISALSVRWNSYFWSLGLQLLWVNIVIDTLGALALATELPTDRLMQRPPIGKRFVLVLALICSSTFLISQDNLVDLTGKHYGFGRDFPSSF